MVFARRMISYFIYNADLFLSEQNQGLIYRLNNNFFDSKIDRTSLYNTYLFQVVY